MKRGFSVIEVVVAAGLFALVSLVLVATLNQAAGTFRRISGRDRAASDLRRAGGRLWREVSLAGPNASAPVPPSLGGFDGDAFWFLSAEDPITGEFARLPDGSPFWQRNVLYYAVVPLQVDQMAGQTVVGGSDTSGYEDRIPYKVLVRKVIDVPPATDTSDEDTIETLLSDPSPYLTRPTRLDLTALAAEPGVEQVEIVCARLVSFRANRGLDYPDQVEFDLRAVALDEVKKQQGIGTTQLLDGPFTLHHLVSVRPRN